MESTGFGGPERVILESNLSPTDQEVLGRFNERVHGPIKERLGQVEKWLTAKPREFGKAAREVDRFFRSLNSELSDPKSAVLRESLPPETQFLANVVKQRPIATLSTEQIPDQNKDFEPLGQTEEPRRIYPPGKHRFINNYGGPYAMKMELNEQPLNDLFNSRGWKATLLFHPYHILVRADI